MEISLNSLRKDGLLSIFIICGRYLLAIVITTSFMTWTVVKFKANMVGHGKPELSIKLILKQGTRLEPTSTPIKFVRIISRYPYNIRTLINPSVPGEPYKESIMLGRLVKQVIRAGPRGKASDEEDLGGMNLSDSKK